MQYDFLIIGSSGMQGRIVSRDLLQSGYRVALADMYREGSEKNMSDFPGTPFSFIDLRDYDTAADFVKKTEPKVVVNCAEGDWNIEVYRMALAAGAHVLDLGSDIPNTKEQIAMHEQFKKAGLTALTGCGSTPGVNNVMARYAVESFKDVDTIELGFAWDSNVKKFVVPFSMASIFEELTDPADVYENGVFVEKMPNATEEVREFREIGKQKCFFVRHPETFTMVEEYKHLGLKNLRFYAGFPDHALEVLHKLIALGMDGEDQLPYENIQLRPVDALSRILTRLPRPENYTEKENLWVEISGHDKEDGTKIMKMECIVVTVPDWLDAGCNIDTGLPCSIMAQMVLDGRIADRGSFAPESVVPARDFFAELKKRGMTVFQDGVAVEV
jgi:lysine 6-dehydrogenase